jgi:3-dehydroquinate synthase
MKEVVRLSQVGYNIYIDKDAFVALAVFLEENIPGKEKMFLLADENTARYCLPLLPEDILQRYSPERIVVQPGEYFKTLASCERVWSVLAGNRAGRKSLLINLGGGTVTDLGGFAASVYKRGMAYVNLPTTLLAMTDAATGGKTGVNYRNLRNAIGSFAPPAGVFINTDFLATLPSEHLLSGYAEIIKHALIADAELWEELQDTSILPADGWDDLIVRSLAIKNKIVAADPYEKGERRLLNFGHTAGHAFETAVLDQAGEPLLHGHAVALGMICEAFLSARQASLPDSELIKIVDFLTKLFPLPSLQAVPNDNLIGYMRQDKKNEGGRINFTLLGAPGKGMINRYCDAALVEKALDYCRNLK